MVRKIFSVLRLRNHRVPSERCRSPTTSLRSVGHWYNGRFGADGDMNDTIRSRLWHHNSWEGGATGARRSIRSSDKVFISNLSVTIKIWQDYVVMGRTEPTSAHGLVTHRATQYCQDFIQSNGLPVHSRKQSTFSTPSRIKIHIMIITY